MPGTIPAIPMKVSFLSSFRDSRSTAYQNYQLRTGFCCHHHQTHP